jgi:hypothetical protein
MLADAPHYERQGKGKSGGESDEAKQLGFFQSLLK